MRTFILFALVWGLSFVNASLASAENSEHGDQCDRALAPLRLHGPDVVDSAYGDLVEIYLDVFSDNTKRLGGEVKVYGGDRRRPELRDYAPSRELKLTVSSAAGEVDLGFIWYRINREMDAGTTLEIEYDEATTKSIHVAAAYNLQAGEIRSALAARVLIEYPAINKVRFKLSDQEMTQITSERLATESRETNALAEYRGGESAENFTFPPSSAPADLTAADPSRDRSPWRRVDWSAAPPRSISVDAVMKLVPQEVVNAGIELFRTGMRSVAEKAQAMASLGGDQLGAERFKEAVAEQLANIHAEGASEAMAAFGQLETVRIWQTLGFTHTNEITPDGWITLASETKAKPKTSEAEYGVPWVFGPKTGAPD